MKRAAQDKRAKTGGKAAKRVKSGDAAPPAADHATQEHATQESEEAPAEFLFGVARSSVVGIRYYNGVVSKDEKLTLRREPANQYDANAIQVLNISGQQVGHIPRTLAKRLAPVMDAAKRVQGQRTSDWCPFRVEGWMPMKPRGSFAYPIALAFFGHESSRRVVNGILARPILSKMALVDVRRNDIGPEFFDEVALLQDPTRGDRGAAARPDRAVASRTLVTHVQRLKGVLQNDQIEGLFDMSRGTGGGDQGGGQAGNLWWESLPEAARPAGMNPDIQLYEHQSKGVTWMVPKLRRSPSQSRAACA
mmetsp:Transcript_17983/g.55026  ORF Transcript_17983/g.55026 Transcript_17983/m.55026 type:complete len:306 (+) Transcript_17983:171-1088(+)